MKIIFMCGLMGFLVLSGSGGFAEETQGNKGYIYVAPDFPQEEIEVKGGIIEEGVYKPRISSYKKRIKTPIQAVWGNYKVIKKDNELYLETLTDPESKQITFTPYNAEDMVSFTKDGQYILFRELPHTILKKCTLKEYEQSARFYMVDRDSAGFLKKEITHEEYWKLKKERFR